jgi:hypothetical protein
VKDFNRVFSFLFINSKINSLLFWLSSGLQNNSVFITPRINEAKIAKSIYKKQIRRYLGLGFFFSFIPGTEAFLARETLLANIEKLESTMDGIDNLIPWVMKTPLHIFVRTYLSIVINNYKHTIASILFGQEEEPERLNRLNPLLYPAQLIFSFIIFIINSSGPFSIINFIKDLPLILKIPVYPILFLIGCIVFPVLMISVILYFTTELILNSLNTLVIEPFKFAYEVIHQLITNWDLDFASMPTDDYNKINTIIGAIDKKLIDEAKQTSSLHIYQAEKLTLIESTEALVNSMEKHRDSFFFELYKKTNLFQKDEKTIAASYNQLANLRKFSYFTHKEMLNQFPKELKVRIKDTCFELDTLDANQKDEVCNIILS